MTTSRSAPGLLPGGGFGKALRLGERAAKLDPDAYCNVIRPKAGSDTRLLQAMLALVFAK